MKGFDDRTKDLMSRHEENEETKTGLEKRIKNVERKMRDLDEQQQLNTLDLRREIDTSYGNPDPTATNYLEKKMQKIDQMRRKDYENIQDVLMDLCN
jgi:beta-xylosidase